MTKFSPIGYSLCFVKKRLKPDKIMYFSESHSVTRIVSKMVESECNDETASSSTKPEQPAPKRPTARPLNIKEKKNPKVKKHPKIGSGGDKQQTTIFNFFKR